MLILRDMAIVLCMCTCMLPMLGKEGRCQGAVCLRGDGMVASACWVHARRARSDEGRAVSLAQDEFLTNFETSLRARCLQTACVQADADGWMEVEHVCSRQILKYMPRGSSLPVGTVTGDSPLGEHPR